MAQVTIPETKNINRQAGSLVLTIEDDSLIEANLLKTGPFLIKKDATGFMIQTSPTNIQKQLRVNANPIGKTTLLWTWIKNNHRLIAINSTTNEVVQALKENSSMNEDFGLIDLSKPSIQVDGLSVQNAGSGKNLYQGNNSLMRVVSSNVFNTGSRTSLKAGTYTFSIKEVKNLTKWRMYWAVFKNGVPVTETSATATHFLAVGIYKSAEYYLSSSDTTQLSYSITLDNDYEVAWGFSGGDSTSISEMLYPQIELASSATAYEPPAPTPDYPIAINSLDKSFDIVSSTSKRNLIKDGDKIVLSPNNTGLGTSTLMSDEQLPYYRIIATNTISTYEAPVWNWLIANGTVGKQYTLSVDVRTPTGGVVNFMGGTATSVSGNIPQNVWTRIYLTFNYVPGKRYGGLVHADKQLDYRNWKLEEDTYSNSSPAPEDIQYNTQSANIYKTNIVLNSSLRSIGNVKDKVFLDTDNLWKVLRKIGTYTFTGDETLTTVQRENTTLFVTTNSIKAVITGKDSTNLLSTHFPAKAIYELDEEGVYLNPSGLFRLSVKNSRLATLNPAGLKNWLAGKNVTIQFELATSTTETLPTEQQNYLNGLEKNIKGKYLYSLSGNFMADSKSPYFLGSFSRLSIYSQDVLYNTASTDLLAKLKDSGTVLFDADYTKPMHYAKKPYLEATMAPRDNSPILVNDEEGPMQRQYFFNQMTGLYAETNTESFVYRGENELFVSYDKLDPTYTVTVRCGAESIGEPVTVIDNRILLTMTPEQKEYWYGKTFDVTYRLARSYTVEYNEQAAHDSYLVRLENHQDQEITITQEGNRFSNQRLMKEIELNPIVNPQHTGFMYISKEEQVSQAFRLTLSSNYIIANGLDSADFIVEVIDQDGNEVLSPYVDVFIMNELGLVTSQFGSFLPIINKDTLKAKNAAGRSYYKYQAPLIRKGDTKKTQKVFAVAYDRKHKIGAQVPLILRPSEPVYDVTGTNYLKINLPLQTRSDASIVFEYFARYYEKPIPAGHPILLLDSDGDGVLTYTDLNQFLIEQTNAVRMQEIAYALRETEAF